MNTGFCSPQPHAPSLHRFAAKQVEDGMEIWADVTTVDGIGGRLSGQAVFFENGDIVY